MFSTQLILFLLNIKLTDCIFYWQDEELPAPEADLPADYISVEDREILARGGTPQPKPSLQTGLYPILVNQEQ